MDEGSAQVVPVLQIAVLHAPTQTALLPVPPAIHIEAEAAPPPLAAPLSLLCTLRI
jgi:hypothetical protein